jgi:ubiquinone/menaquinone biosynthesis C-methylase UbiE
MTHQNQIKKIGVREWYDFIGGLADVLPGIHLGGSEATQTLLELCQPKPTTRVLDAGCGPGITSCMIASQFGSEVIGVDISPVMIDYATRKAEKMGLTGRVRFQVADILDLPFSEGYFDLVIAESILTPLPGDKRLALQELGRVLSPGGLLAINESGLSIEAPEDLHQAMAEHPAIQGYFTTQTLKDIIESQGLSITVHEEFTSADSQSTISQIGIKNLLLFMIRAYPKVIWKLFTDKRFRRASQVDNQITKKGAEYLKYSLILCQKTL